MYVILKPKEKGNISCNVFTFKNPSFEGWYFSSKIVGCVFPFYLFFSTTPFPFRNIQQRKGQSFLFLFYQEGIMLSFLPRRINCPLLPISLAFSTETCSLWRMLAVFVKKNISEKWEKLLHVIKYVQYLVRTLVVTL